MQETVIRVGGVTNSPNHRSHQSLKVTQGGQGHAARALRPSSVLEYILHSLSNAYGTSSILYENVYECVWMRVWMRVGTLVHMRGPDICAENAQALLLISYIWASTKESFLPKMVDWNGPKMADLVLEMALKSGTNMYILSQNEPVLLIYIWLQWGVTFAYKTPWKLHF